MEITDLETGSSDDAGIVDLDLQPHDVAACRRAHQSGSDRFLANRMESKGEWLKEAHTQTQAKKKNLALVQCADVARVLKVINHIVMVRARGCQGPHACPRPCTAPKKSCQSHCVWRRRKKKSKVL